MFVLNRGWRIGRIGFGIWYEIGLILFVFFVVDFICLSISLVAFCISLVRSIWYFGLVGFFGFNSKVSQRREVADAREVFQDAKTKSPRPRAVVHDGLQSYNEAFNREYYSKKDLHIQNIRSVSVKKKGLNQKVERLNGTMRDREKVMRGMHNKDSS